MNSSAADSETSVYMKPSTGQTILNTRIQASKLKLQMQEYLIFKGLVLRYLCH